MATIIEQLLTTMNDDEKATMRRKLAENPQILVDDAEAGNLLSIFKGTPESTPDSAAVSTVASTAVHTPALPSAAATSAAPQPVTPIASTASLESSKILEALNNLKSTMDDRLKNVITSDQLPKMRGEMLSLTIRNAHETFRMEADHEKMFGEKLDLDKVAEFIGAQEKLGAKFPSIRAAYDAMTKDKRDEVTIAAKVAEQVKQKTSGAAVPAVSTSSSLSPAQQVNAKARQDAQSGGGTRLQKLIADAAALERARENSSAAN